MAYINLLEDDNFDVIYVQFGSVNEPFLHEYNEMILSVLDRNSFTEIESYETLYLKIDKKTETYTFVDNILEKRNQDREYLASRKEIILHFNNLPKVIINLDLERLVDNSIPAYTQFVLEEFENSGFKYKNVNNRNYRSKYLRVNFLNKTLTFTNQLIENDEPNSDFKIDDLKKLFDKYFTVPEWFRHETLHTTSVMLESINSHLVDHHYYDQKINPAFNENIDKAIDYLWKAYQAVGDHEENEVMKYMKKATIDF